MINLLPTDMKAEIRAARTNIILLRYIGITLLALIFALALLYVSYVTLTQTKDGAQQVIDSNEAKAGVYSDTKSQVDSLSASLSGAKSILDEEVLYSKVLTNIAQQMPAGTVIDSMELSPSSFGAAPVTLKVYAKKTEDTTALREKFQTSPLFTNVNFQSVSESGDGIPGYPVSVTMTLTLNKAARS